MLAINEFKNHIIVLNVDAIDLTKMNKARKNGIKRPKILKKQSKDFHY